MWHDHEKSDYDFVMVKKDYTVQYLYGEFMDIVGSGGY
jgi:hypothetical protein